MTSPGTAGFFCSVTRLVAVETVLTPIPSQDDCLAASGPSLGHDFVQVPSPSNFHVHSVSVRHQSTARYSLSTLASACSGQQTHWPSWPPDLRHSSRRQLWSCRCRQHASWCSQQWKLPCLLGHPWSAAQTCSRHFRRFEPAHIMGMACRQACWQARQRCLLVSAKQGSRWPSS